MWGLFEGNNNSRGTGFVLQRLFQIHIRRKSGLCERPHQHEVPVTD